MTVLRIYRTCRPPFPPKQPSNIFLTPHGVKLLDFGLTCTTQSLADETLARLTIPGTVIGTPQYAAPEQLRGELIDARADLFAAGAVLYEMLAGKPPFSGNSPVEVFHGIRDMHPPGPESGEWSE